MATFTLPTQNSTSFTNLLELGASWVYNKTGLTYNQISFEAKPVKYNSIGVTNAFTNTSQNTTAYNNQTKN